MVRAKFKVREITEHAYGSQLMKTIKLEPVLKNNDPESENSRFWAASPNGEIRLGTINMDAAAQFAINAEFYVDFIPVDEPRS
jgi:hypothetical protein